MLIVWGTRDVERGEGSVADFCPIGRDLQSFRLVRVERVRHLYYIPVDKAEVAGHFIRCDTCEAKFTVDRSRYREAVAPERSTFDELIAATHPDLRDVYADRLALEATIRRSPHAVSGARRAELLMEPFELLNSQAEKRFYVGTKFDKPSGIGCLGTL